MLLLQIWSYERFDIGLPTPYPQQGRYPVALFWAYPKAKAVEGEVKGKSKPVLGKRQRRRGSKGPHHNLPHYRGEFDGVGSDIVKWTPYAHFEAAVECEPEEGDRVEGEVPAVGLHLDWNIIEAQFAGQSRLPMICFDICEYQHSDRVLRQFGLRPCIPRPPVDMKKYRMPKLKFHACNSEGQGKTDPGFPNEAAAR
ncbi:hypothetical protein DCAR_0625832 [Daucus carota subsp. sativus]|uniref:Aminotransferase-like plant mobile domain-containing protein n=1 Tax=Daucus carota subsp. sativus TaxID=79200 RepID=A0AAF0XHA3_DAUCS|nr:hypothetical protein DCAR_0625832 [Daucus carota subsp. sativus]